MDTRVLLEPETEKQTDMILITSPTSLPTCFIFRGWRIEHADLSNILLLKYGDYNTVFHKCLSKMVSGILLKLERKGCKLQYWLHHWLVCQQENMGTNITLTYPEWRLMMILIHFNILKNLVYICLKSIVFSIFMSAWLHSWEFYKFYCSFLVHHHSTNKCSQLQCLIFFF